MASYSARIHERLGPISRNQIDISKMLKEWYATGHVEDRGRAVQEDGDGPPWDEVEGPLA